MDSDVKSNSNSEHEKSDNSDEEMFTKSKNKQRKLKNIVDSDDEEETVINNGKSHSSSSDESSHTHSNNTKKKKRIVRRLSDSDSEKSESNIINSNSANDNNSSSDDENEKSNYSQSSRIKEKNIKFENKFKSMLAMRKKAQSNEQHDENKNDDDKVSESKSKVSNLYDSESEDEREEDPSEDIARECHMEDELPFTKSVGKKIKKNNVVQDKPKEQRMSAKQAMEQMHKIKSESGRMMRQKEVSLPYHRPRQMSLKDILAKRKANALPPSSRFGFKMSSDELKQYAKELEEREKQILELCKSESEEEEENNEETSQNNEENKTDDIKDDKQNKSPATAQEHKEEFTSLQQACKNLLDIFDKDEESSNTGKPIQEVFQEATENIKDKEETEYIKENNEESNENIPVETETIQDNNTEQLDTVNDDSAKPTSEDVIKDELANSNVDTADDAMEVTGEQTNALPDSELLFNDTEMECEFKIEDAINEVNKNYNANVAADGDNIDGDYLKRKCATQDEDKKHPSSDLSQQISCSAPVQPKLQGSPGCFIDLISGEVKSGVELLKKKFMFHAAIKTPEELEREKERRIQPGSALQKLKRELESKMMDSRTQEWSKRLEDMKQKRKEDNDNLSDMEDLLEKEEGVACSKGGEGEEGEESGEEEEEPEENDMELKDSNRKKCQLLDQEAEVEDDEGNEISPDEDDSDSSEDDSGDDLADTGVKKPLTRIIKPLNDSDSSDDDDDSQKLEKQSESSNVDTTVPKDSSAIDELMTPVKESKLVRSNTSDLFDSQSASKNNSFSYEWDEMPLGQKIQNDSVPTPSGHRLSNVSLTDGKTNTTGRSDLAGLVSPIITLTGVPRISSQQKNSEEIASPNKYEFQYETDKINNLQKKLLFDSEEGQSTQDLLELESLCSGKFPSQDTTNNSQPSNKPSNLERLIDDKEGSELTQDLENELLGLCTGKFVGINDTQTQGMDTLPVDDSQNITLSLSETQNTEELIKSLKKKTSPSKTNDSERVKKTKDCKINSFFKSGNSKQSEDIVANDKQEISVTNVGGKLAILSSEEEENINENGEVVKSKVLKSKKERNKKKKYHLQFSDEESDNEMDNEPTEDLSESENLDEDKIVDYDSEENEIEVQKAEVIKPKKKKTSEFFEQEAELTSEDEWVGSGDEDERGLDRLEREEGDDDQLDEKEVKDQLERIHMRTVLDEDKREIKMLQEILLEDDLEGGTRERKFKWRNVDSEIDVGATLGDEDVEGTVEDMQTEEEWRKQRHERETYLRQMMEKENSDEFSQFSQNSESSYMKIVSRTTIIAKKSLTKDPVQNTDIPMHGDTEDVNKCNGDKNKKINKDLPSPVKKPFALLKNNVRGSFLSRGQAALNRLAMLTKNTPQAPEEGEPTNLSSLAPGKKKNFVFATVSPPCNKNNMPEDVKIAKRKATSEISTPVLIKKTKIIEETTLRSRKSLLDHISH